MAAKKTAKQQDMPAKEEYKGKQLLQLDRYNNRVARIVLKADESYSYDKADELISDYLKKKG